ncbi:hypothetical protein [Sphingobacterium sp. LRF_L2]|uniref:hypothetical protein n=1 Tax=Sphingobacterium sp. LRF_L2 TaxID=3369421 RepID=UPI003F60F7ED
MATHIWLPLVIAAIVFILQVAIPVMRADSGKIKYSFLKHVLPLCISMLLIILCIFELPNWSSALLNKYGDEGTGVITRIEQTNNMYNKQYIQRYTVIIKDEAGKTIETYFNSSDFNVYPSENIVSYPGVGEQFALKYLPSDPKLFVILANSKSAYTKRIYCQAAFEALIEARIKFEADSSNSTYRNVYIRAVQDVLNNACYENSPSGERLIERDKKIIEKLIGGN